MFTHGQMVLVTELLGPVGEQRIRQVEGVFLDYSPSGWLAVDTGGGTIEMLDAKNVSSLVGEVS